MEVIVYSWDGMPEQVMVFTFREDARNWVRKFIEDQIAQDPGSVSWEDWNNDGDFDSPLPNPVLFSDECFWTDGGKNEIRLFTSIPVID